MNDTAIRVENLGKRYRIGVLQKRHDTLRDLLVSVFRPSQVQRLLHPDDDTFWALKDISFEVKHGEAVGIIGRNGAGKSTLLKILSRITEPTEGGVDVWGRIASLLEVGTGFHPELTGRENIYLNGAILGMGKAEIKRKFDEIVAFADIERFLDTPVKRYSSGMYVKLAFAVAAHLESDILLVDEVLAVGDVAFQQRCLGKMGDITRQGRAVVFVSHNMGAIQSLTENCLYIKSGKLVHYGGTRDTIGRYIADSVEARFQSRAAVDYYRRNKGIATPTKFSRVWVNDISDSMPVVKTGESFKLFLEMETSDKIEGANLTVILKDSAGHHVVVFFSWDEAFYVFLDPGTHIIELTVNGLPLAPGDYYADIGVNRSTSTMAYDVLLDVPLLRMEQADDITFWNDRQWGSVHWRDCCWNLDVGTTGNSNSNS